MKGDRIAYRAGYRYQCWGDQTTQTAIRPDSPIDSEYITLSMDGQLTAKDFYAWNGASDFPDLASIMRGSLFHDVKYQLLRMGLIDEKWRVVADQELRQDCIDDGMIHSLAEAVYIAVECFGAGSAASGTDRPVLTAP